jgi:hypothetical protein
LIYLEVNPKSGTHGKALTDNWGYNYDGLYTLFLLDGRTAYRDAVRLALGNLKEHYSQQGGMCQSNTADGYADSIEGAITLYNREPVASAAEWINEQIRVMWAKQQPDGIIEGWHGDGNSARTSLMYALWKTQGVTAEPWRADLRFGAVRQGEGILLQVAAAEKWEGRLKFDQARHKRHMKLPLDYPRINQVPEWFTVEGARNYAVLDPDTNHKRNAVTGRQLADGLPLTLAANQPVNLIIAPVHDSPANDQAPGR